MRNRTFLMMTGLASFLGGPLGVMAGEAQTSATAGSRGWGPGTAAATANYTGEGVGFTRTRANSGKLNFARGLSVGFDEDGLSLSHSYAVAPQHGPAIGGTFNMHVGLDGESTLSVGRVAAQGDPNRTVTVGGSAGRDRGSPRAMSAAHGQTGPRGEVRAQTHSRQSRSGQRVNRSMRRMPTRRLMRH